MTTPPTVYFTCDEVVIHNKADDIWVIVHKMVFELTNLIKERSQTMSDVSFENFSEIFVFTPSFSFFICWFNMPAKI